MREIYSAANRGHVRGHTVGPALFCLNHCLDQFAENKSLPLLSLSLCSVSSSIIQGAASTMHKNNRIYLLNILQVTQPCHDWINRAQACWIVVFLSLAHGNRPCLCSCPHHALSFCRVIAAENTEREARDRRRVAEREERYQR